jgi:hypothetical protein
LRKSMASLKGSHTNNQLSALQRIYPWIVS